MNGGRNGISGWRLRRKRGNVFDGRGYDGWDEKVIECHDLTKSWQSLKEDALKMVE